MEVGRHQDAREQYEHWKKTMEMFFEILKVSKETKLYFLTSHVSSKLFQYICDKITYEDSIFFLDKVFVKQSHGFKVYRLFTRKHKPGESLNTFIQSLNQLSHDCKFGNKSAEENRKEAVCVALIQRLLPSVIRTHILEKEDISLKHAFDVAVGITSLEEAARFQKTSLNTIVSESEDKHAGDLNKQLLIACFSEALFHTLKEEVYDNSKQEKLQPPLLETKRTRSPYNLRAPIFYLKVYKKKEDNFPDSSSSSNTIRETGDPLEETSNQPEASTSQNFDESLTTTKKQRNDIEVYEADNITPRTPDRVKAKSEREDGKRLLLSENGFESEQDDEKTLYSKEGKESLVKREKNLETGMSKRVLSHYLHKTGRIYRFFSDYKKRLLHMANRFDARVSDFYSSSRPHVQHQPLRIDDRKKSVDEKEEEEAVIMLSGVEALISGLEDTMHLANVTKFMVNESEVVAESMETIMKMVDRTITFLSVVKKNATSEEEHAASTVAPTLITKEGLEEISMTSEPTIPRSSTFRSTEIREKNATKEILTTTASTKTTTPIEREITEVVSERVEERSTRLPTTPKTSKKPVRVTIMEGTPVVVIEETSTAFRGDELRKRTRKVTTTTTTTQPPPITSTRGGRGEIEHTSASNIIETRRIPTRREERIPSAIFADESSTEIDRVTLTKRPTTPATTTTFKDEEAVRHFLTSTLDTGIEGEDRFGSFVRNAIRIVKEGGIKSSILGVSAGEVKKPNTRRKPKKAEISVTESRNITPKFKLIQRVETSTNGEIEKARRIRYINRPSELDDRPSRTEGLVIGGSVDDKTPSYTKSSSASEREVGMRKTATPKPIDTMKAELKFLTMKPAINVLISRFKKILKKEVNDSNNPEVLSANTDKKVEVDLGESLDGMRINLIKVSPLPTNTSRRETEKAKVYKSFSKLKKISKTSPSTNEMTTPSTIYINKTDSKENRFKEITSEVKGYSRKPLIEIKTPFEKKNPLVKKIRFDQEDDVEEEEEEDKEKKVSVFEERRNHLLYKALRSEILQKKVITPYFKRNIIEKDVGLPLIRLIEAGCRGLVRTGKILKPTSWRECVEQFIDFGDNFRIIEKIQNEQLQYR